ncbi:MAG: polysaccharide pyruvyl transferase family protein, partial [Oscillospiraceae bacterium]|nr:polysaccharide pyruvyl transferase family protein [Oscillospiraceae bacterium]
LEILEKAAVITVREEDSFEYARELGLQNQNIYVTADPAFNLESASSERIDAILEQNGIEGEYFAVSVRPWAQADREFAQKMTSLCTRIQEKHRLTPVFIIMQGAKDDRITRSICARISGAKILEIYEDTPDVIGVISRAKFMIGMRLHAIIYSAVAGKPFVAISYDPKVAAVTDSLGMSEFLENVDNFDVDRIIKNIDVIRVKGDILEGKVKNLRKETLKDIACVRKILTKN